MVGGGIISLNAVIEKKHIKLLSKENTILIISL